MIDLQTFSNRDYDPGPFLKRAIWLIVSRVFFETSIPWPSALKARLLGVFGAKVGTCCVIKPGVKIKYPWFLEIGQSCWIGEQIWIDNVASVKIGEQVVISQGAVLLTGNHDYKSPSFDLRAEPIVIENGAWICAHSRVGPGVIVGELAVLGFGSVATKSLEAGGVFSGNPAEKIRERSLDE